MSSKRKDQDKNIGRIADRPYWLTYVSLVARAVHQIGAAVFLAAYLLGVSDTAPIFYLILATVSGFILMGVEAIRHRQLLREVSGLVTLAKLVIIGLAFHATSHLPQQSFLPFSWRLIFPTLQKRYATGSSYRYEDTIKSTTSCGLLISN